MDVAKTSMAMSQANVKQQSTLAVMNQAKSHAEQQGSQMVEMLSDSAPHPTKGSQIDVKG
ncbi:YjfB family protein [Halobacillus sp. A5]|uniref:YjfB family protein n=1 Tax=Halobacillus sp. A5 TaxID=2880263 RepID=UPI0020A6C344|nr:YjfB family protein [Halobacillus sp. A5]MCP3027603.1 YjfB family protein [Halobacillus sp. A5]